MSWTMVTDTLASICLIGGAFFSLVAAIGAVRFTDLYSRMHAATKPQVLGLLLILLGLALRLLDPNAMGMLLLTGAAQLLTAPVTAHMVSRAALRNDQVDDEIIVATDVEREDEPE